MDQTTTYEDAARVIADLESCAERIREACKTRGFEDVGERMVKTIEGMIEDIKTEYNKLALMRMRDDMPTNSHWRLI